MFKICHYCWRLLIRCRRRVGRLEKPWEETRGWVIVLSCVQDQRWAAIIAGTQWTPVASRFDGRRGTIALNARRTCASCPVSKSTMSNARKQSWNHNQKPAPSNVLRTWAFNFLKSWIPGFSSFHARMVRANRFSDDVRSVIISVARCLLDLGEFEIYFCGDFRTLQFPLVSQGREVSSAWRIGRLPYQMMYRRW